MAEAPRKKKPPRPRSAPTPRRGKGGASARGVRPALMTRWLLVRLALLYLGVNLALNLFLSLSQPLRPLRLMTLRRIDERLDAAGLLVRHHVPVHACEGSLGPAELRELAQVVATSVGVEAALLLAVADAESGFQAHAVSPVGAVGVAQLMPSTARWMGVDDPFEPRQNLEGSARYLKDLLRRYKGDMDRTIAAYNAGPGAVRRHGGIPPFPETRAYVARVSQRLRYYRSVALPGRPAAPDTAPSPR